MLNSFQRFIVLCCLLTAVSTITALHEDQQGLWDWYRAGIGDVVQTLFPSAASHKFHAIRHAVVRSKQNVIAGVLLGNGGIRWRKIYAESDPVVGMALGDSWLLVATASGQIHEIDPADGTLIEASKAGTVPPQSGFAFSNSALTHVVGRAEEIVGWFPVSGDGKVSPKTDRTTKLNKACNLNTNITFSPNGLWYECGGIVGSTRADTTADGTLADVEGDRVIAVKPDAMSLLSMAGDAPSKCTYSAAGITTAAGFVRVHRDSNNAAVAATVVNNEIHLIDDTCKKTATLGIPTEVLSDAQYGKPRRATVFVTSKGTLTSLIVTADGALHYCTAEATKWVLEEGLAMPAMSAIAHHRNLTTGSTHSAGPRIDLASGLASLKAVFGVKSASAGPTYTALSPTQEQKFGFNVRLLVLSETGKLYAMGTKSSSPVWVAYLGGSGQTLRMLHLSVTGHTAIVAFAASSGTSKVVFHAVSVCTLSGAVLRQTESEPSAAPASYVDVVEGDDVVFVNNDASVILLSLKSANRATRGRSTSHTSHFAVYSKERNTLEGYSLALPATSANGKVVKTFTVSHQAPLVAITSGSAHALSTKSVENYRIYPVTAGAATQGEVRPKYNTRNLIVTAYLADGGSTLDDEETSPLVVTAIDGVTGSAVAYTRIPDAAGPVNLLVVEHMVLVFYVNVRKMKAAVQVWEMFSTAQPSMPEHATVSPAVVAKAFLPTSSPMYRPHAAPLPTVSTHTLYMTTTPTAVGTTVSLQGIARKMLLLALANGHIMSVESRMLEKQPDVPAAKGQPPPPAAVHLPLTSVISHKQLVFGAHHITTAPTHLESTSNVIVCGLDTFYTRTAAGKAFDLLNEDFNFSLLVVLLAILSIGAVVTKVLSARKALGLQWS